LQYWRVLGQGAAVSKMPSSLVPGLPLSIKDLDQAFWMGKKSLNSGGSSSSLYSLSLK
jgi:hypothetical protein